MGHLLVENAEFHFVVGFGKDAMQGGDLDVVDGEAPCCHCCSNRGEVGVLLPEVVEPHNLSVARRSQ